ncbi:MAG: DGQHR domain-containing protein [Chloroflexi bacterium]|nr:DGQHR domain-containing protein [Chloroflexota bacterium]
MAPFKRPAVQIRQGSLTLYLTYVTPQDLFSGDFYTVSELEPKSDEPGYQRILNKTRARRLAKHLIEAHPAGYAHLPTTVFLATDSSVNFCSSSNVLEFDTDEVGPFSVVDGQHRIDGLRRACKDRLDLLDFRLPVTLATDLDAVHQMYHFFIVNTTQVPVDPSLRQQITRRFTDMRDVEKLPYLPYWLERETAAGKDARALRIAESLNEATGSPLRDRIQMANDPVGRNKIKQASIVNLFKKELLTPANPIAVQETDVERQSKITLNFFKAVDRLLVDGRDRAKTVVYKSNGLFFCLGVSKWIFSAIYSSTRDFTVESISQLLQKGFEELDDEHRVVASPDWWMPGPRGASGLNRSTARAYVDSFQRALARANQSDEIQL